MSMTRFVAFLRGIGPSNPNMRNDRLREACEALGLRNVATVASSGNLIFDADTADPAALEATLEAAWPERLGFQSTSIVRTCEELASLRDLAPFADREHSKASYLLITFAKDRVEPTFPMPHQPDSAALTVVGGTGRELFTATDTTTARTPDTMKWLEREFGKATTSRTFPAVLRILDRCTAEA